MPATILVVQDPGTTSDAASTVGDDASVVGADATGDGAASIEQQSPGTLPIDGRRARRDRGRNAVIDAMFELLQESPTPLVVEQVAQRSGVSVSSIFRYFGGLDDLQEQTFDRFLERFSALIEVPVPVTADTGQRIRAFVGARLELYGATGNILRVARLRALEHPQLAQAATGLRGLLAEQVRDLFASELADIASPARTSEMVALVDSLASPEAWDCLVLSHRRSTRQIRTSWEWALGALLAEGALR